MKNLKAISLIAVSMLALAGCSPTGTTTTTSTTTTPTTSTSTETKTTTTEMKKVGTPSDAEKMNEVEAAGNRVVTYSSKASSDDAFAAQAKMVTDAGWNGSYQGMTAPVKAMGTVTQTFSGGGKILVLAVTADPMNQGMTLVTMTESADPMAQ